ncbi:cytochrome P450 [Streptomyces sp. NPDC001414]
MGSAKVTPAISPRALISLFSRLRTSDGQADPLPAYRNLLALGEVVPAPWGGHLVNSYRLCDGILRDRTWRVPDAAWRAVGSDAERWKSPSFLQMSKTLPMLNQPEHGRARGALGNVFTPAVLDEIRPGMERTVNQLLDRFTDRLRDGPADFVTLVSEEIPVATIGEWMRIPPADYGLLRDLTHDQVFTQELVPTASDIAVSDAATAELRAYFFDLIGERRKRPGDDPVSSWIQAWDDLEPDRERADENAHSLALFMILAALETTSHLLADAVRLLLEHPRQLEDLRRHPELMPGVIDEVLRYDAPIHMISRVASEDAEIGGTHVRAGEMAHLMIGAAHHDPAQYTRPAAFNVRRRLEGSSAAHLGFGAGVHYCLGRALAHMEASALLTGLLERSLRLEVSAPPQWAPRIVFRRLLSLELTHA